MPCTADLGNDHAAEPQTATRSPAQIEASRRNGAASRGPCTTAGKARSSGNAMRPGLRARCHVLLDGEDAAAFAALEAGMLQLLGADDARGPLAAHLARQLAGLVWRRERAVGLETDAVAGLGEGPPGMGELERAAERRLSLTIRYQTQLSRDFFRMLKELPALRALVAKAAEVAVQTTPDAAASAAEQAMRPVEPVTLPDPVHGAGRCSGSFGESSPASRTAPAPDAPTPAAANGHQAAGPIAAPALAPGQASPRSPERSRAASLAAISGSFGTADTAGPLGQTSLSAPRAAPDRLLPSRPATGADRPAFAWCPPARPARRAA